MNPTTIRSIVFAVSALALVPATAAAQHHHSHRRHHRQHQAAAAGGADVAASAELTPTEEAMMQTPEEAAPATPPAPPTRTPPPSFEIDVAMRVLHRELAYNQDLYGQFSPYQLDAAPAIAVSMDWFPFAHVNPDSPLGQIGLMGQADVALGVSSMGTNNTERGTNISQYFIGLRGRLPLGNSELGVVLGYGAQRFEMDGDDRPTDLNIVPNIAYEYVRMGARARVAINDRFSFLADANYLAVVGLGEIRDRYFPRAQAAGIDFSLGLAVRIASGFEARASFGMRRYFFDMHPRPGDEYVMGGATDDYYHGALGIAWRQ